MSQHIVPLDESSLRCWKSDNLRNMLLGLRIRCDRFKREGNTAEVERVGRLVAMYEKILSERGG